MAHVYWLISAQRALLAALSPSVPAGKRGEVYRRLSDILARTFPGAAAILVRERLSGYRLHYDRHVLVVEVINKTEALRSEARSAVRYGKRAAATPSAAIVNMVDFERGQDELCHSILATAAVVKTVVKVPEAEDPPRPTPVQARFKEARLLEDEMKAWNSCRPIGMSHHGILMMLNCGAVDPDGRLESIVYQDAHHVLGGRQIMPLEDAVLNCAGWRLASVESLRLVIKCIYEQLGADLYSRSRVLLDPSKTVEAVRRHVFDNKTRLHSVQKWQERGRTPLEPERLRTRREVVGVLADKPEGFIDPADYLASVLECPEHCPQLLCGCAHGDLHGRNILVSIAGGDATLPALFDYADMGPGNLVGWDFVKLETELKVRALPLVFPGKEVRYIRQLYDFEAYLARRTQRLNEQEPGEEPWNGPEGGKRVADMVMAIRESAREHLGRRRHREYRWLEEYYFLLALYGVHASCWETYQRRNVMAAWVSAGVAARLLARPWQQLDTEVRKQEAIAEGLLNDAGFDPAEYPLDRELCEMSHQPRLAFCRTWCRSGKRSFVEAAAKLLEALSHEYPHVIEIDEELVLQYLELGKRVEAEELLFGITRRYSLLSMELMCRFGRYWKDEGVKRLTKAASLAPSLLQDPVPPPGAEAAQRPTQPAAKSGKAKICLLTAETRKYLQEALRWYARAYELELHYYPGINVATVRHLIGDSAHARKTAQDILDTIRKLPPEQAVQSWATATKGEACLLLARSEEAAKLYREASDALPVRDRCSMRRQAEAIVCTSCAEVRAFWPPERFDEVFGPDTAPCKLEAPAAEPCPAPAKRPEKPPSPKRKPKAARGKAKK